MLLTNSSVRFRERNGCHGHDEGARSGLPDHNRLEDVTLFVAGMFAASRAGADNGLSSEAGADSRLSSDGKKMRIRSG